MPHRHYHSSRHKSSLFASDPGFAFRQRNGHAIDVEAFLAELGLDDDSRIPDNAKSAPIPPSQLVKTAKKPSAKQKDRIKRPAKARQEVIVDEVMPDESTVASEETLEGLSPFTQWLNAQAASASGKGKKRKKQGQKAKTKKHTSRKRKQKAQKKARKKVKKQAPSVILGDDIISETLAELLVAQGHQAKAIEMYEQLRLKYPENSRFFAAKIEGLKTE